MALPIKELIIKAKTRQARLRAIKKLVQNIPANPTFEWYEYDNPQQVGFEMGQSELANKIRAILNGPAFEEAYRPGNIENGKRKTKPKNRI
jgi:hypothetical protein